MISKKDADGCYKLSASFLKNIRMILKIISVFSGRHFHDPEASLQNIQ